ncbi:MAG: desulforedoxin [Candidatus Binatia bacterium]|jgi:hypothetical protein
MANQLGKMYLCGSCGAQIIVTKGGTGTIKCCGAEMQKK